MPLNLRAVLSEWFGKRMNVMPKYTTAAMGKFNLNPVFIKLPQSTFK